MTWLSALAIGLVADVFIAICLALFVHADKRYQAEKAQGLHQVPAEPWDPDRLPQ